MKKASFLLKTLVILLAGVSSSSALAAGFQLNGQSATGLGRAFAGDAVIADNASVIGRNSAAMALFDRPELSVGLVVIDTAPKIKDTTLEFGLIGTPITASTQLEEVDIGGTTPVPNIYYIHPINEKIAVGAGLYSHFGTTTEFPDNYIANLFGGKTNLQSVNLGLNASYRINQQLSLGFGLDIIQGSGELRRFDPNNTSSAGFGLKLEASGLGLGANIGAVYELNEDHRFGLSYRYSPEIKAEIDSGAFFRPTSSKPLTGDLLITLPDIVEFSGYHALDPKFAVHYSVQWIGWSEFEQLKTSENIVLGNYNWKNGWHFSLGGTYLLNEKITLRAGYMYDTSAQDALKSISVPDSDRHWLSAGASYALNENSVFDFGLTYLMGSDVKVNEDLGSGSISIARIDATTHANAWLFGLQYTHKF